MFQTWVKYEPDFLDALTTYHQTGRKFPWQVSAVDILLPGREVGEVIQRDLNTAFLQHIRGEFKLRPPSLVRVVRVQADEARYS